MNSPAVKAASTPSGWADPRLSQAYELVAAVRKDWPNAFIAYAALGEVCDAIERADGDIVEATEPPATPTKGLTSE